MKDFLISNFNLSLNEATLFCDCFVAKPYTAGQKFVSYGDVSHKIGFVEKGFLKCVSIGQTKEVIDDFVFDHQFVANYHSFLTKKASTKDIVCITNSIIRVATRERIEELGKKYAFVEQVARIVAEKLFVATHKKLENILLLNAEERYVELLNSNGQILNKIPQYEIASYLNVSPETVSRIRKKLSMLS